MTFFRIKSVTNSIEIYYFDIFYLATYFFIFNVFLFQINESSFGDKQFFSLRQTSALLYQMSFSFETNEFRCHKRTLFVLGKKSFDANKRNIFF